MEEVFDYFINNHNNFAIFLKNDSNKNYNKKFLDFLKKEEIKNRFLYACELGMENIFYLDNNKIYTDIGYSGCINISKIFYEKDLYLISAYENHAAYTFYLVKFKDEYALNKYKLMKNI